MNVATTVASSPTPDQRRRICQRVAAGWPLDDAAAAEGFSPVEAEALLEDAAFVKLIGAYRHLAVMPEEERRRRLVEMAWQVLELAAIDGDPRVALFFLKEEIRGRRPAEVIARAACRSLNGKLPPKPMTVFVPPHWQQPSRKAPNGSAPTGRPAPAKLSTTQVFYLRIRTRNRTLAYNSAKPAGNDPENHPRQPGGP